MASRKIIVAAIALVVALSLFAMPTLAVDKEPIRIVNNHPAAQVNVTAYDPRPGLAWPWQHCDTLHYDFAKERFISPGHKCGRGEFLGIALTVYAGVDGSVSYNNITTVPWGATITVHQDMSVTCDGCTWTTMTR